MSICEKHVRPGDLRIDVVDKPSTSNAERLAFIRRQRELIEGLYLGIRPEVLQREERMVGDLIQNDRSPNSRLKSYIENFLAVIEFDAKRHGLRITETELRDYSDHLAIAVTDAIQYFIKNGQSYPEDKHRISAARGAHVAHVLRDMRQDLLLGYWNIPREYLEKYGIGPEDMGSQAFRYWVRARVEEAREDFRLGKAYIDRLDVLRTKIAACWYCGRFERVLDTIEKDGYCLRIDYSQGHSLVAWGRMAWIAANISTHHALAQLDKTGGRLSIIVGRLGLGSAVLKNSRFLRLVSSGFMSRVFRWSRRKQGQDMSI